MRTKEEERLTQRLEIVPTPDPEERELLPHEQEFIASVDAVDKYCQSRGEIGGLETGFPRLTECLEGLQPGISVVAGGPNVGKTALCAQLAVRIACNNDNTYCVYHTVDDSSKEVIPRFVAVLMGMPINAVKFPVKYGKRNPSIIGQREEGIRRLKAMSNKIGIHDQTYRGDGSNLENIRSSIEDLLFHLGDEKQLVVFVDNFHDLFAPDIYQRGDENTRYNYIIGELDKLSTVYDLPIICTAELRKHGNKRPTMQDIRETYKTAYDVKLIIGLYNDMDIKGTKTKLFHRGNEIDKNTGEIERLPILEANFIKNKMSSFKGRLYYYFYPKLSGIEEVPPEATSSIEKDALQ